VGGGRAFAGARLAFALMEPTRHTHQDETRIVLGGALSHHARKQAAIAARGE
jgi:hypothetical protein